MGDEKGKVKEGLQPRFETKEQKVEYWNSHSPLDLSAEPKAQKLRVKGAKDRPITVRLDSESRSKLDKLAAEQGLGPSSFARRILMSVIEQDKLPKHSILTLRIEIVGKKGAAKALEGKLKELRLATDWGKPTDRL